MHRRRLTLPLALLVAVTAACSSSATKGDSPEFEQPDASTFRAGACSDVAAAVLALGKDAQALASGTTPDQPMKERLRDNGQVVLSAQIGLPADLAPALNALAVNTGFLRIGLDSNTYEPAMATDVVTAYDGAVAACTTGATPSPS